VFRGSDRLGSPGFVEREVAVRPADCSRADRYHLLLFVDQPDDGDGPRPRRRHSAPPGQFRRISRHDGHDLPGNSDVDRAPATNDIARCLRLIDIHRLHTQFHHATGAAAQGEI